MESLRGRVWSVIHKTDDFYIFSLEPSGRDALNYGRKIVCKGRIFGVQQITAGVSLEVFGKWTSHPKFGRQFDLHGWGPWADTDAGVDTFLRVCLELDEIQTVTLVDAFGVDLFRVLSEEPDKLRDLPGLTEDAITALLEDWAYARTSSELSAFFSHHTVSSTQMKALFEAFGSEAKKVLQENPYRLLEVEGFSFGEVDEVADSMGVERGDPRRFEGAVLWVLREAAKSGHLCVRRGDISAQLRELLQGTDVDAFGDASITEELNKAVLRLQERDGVQVDPNVGVYLPNHFRHERQSAEYLARFLTPVQLDVEPHEFLRSYEIIHQISLSEAQRGAVEKLLSSRVLVLTGLPGTGKTTVVKTFVSLFQQAGITFTLMAPTGIASKRLSEVTGHSAATIHRTFRYDGERWGYNVNNKFPVGAVIVDEMSMVDQELFFRILDALEEGTILVLVGDDAQLPSVGPGNVLRELIRCPEVPTVRLTQIFRQAETSDIILNSHRINRGEAIVPGGEGSDFRFVSIGDEEKLVDLVVRMALKLKDRDANFQVLSPKYEGTVGVSNLNDKLREALNPSSPGKKELVIGALRFREGDRVMVIRNDYELGVYNGDMGKLMTIRTDHVIVKVHGAGEDGLDMLVEFPRKEIPQKLRLAYAITVHKCQGSEFDTVILPIVRAQGRMLQRNLFYTAVTRARKRVWLLGDNIAVSKAIANDQVVQRNTGFERAITRAFNDIQGKLIANTASGVSRGSGDSSEEAPTKP
jgi:exodeoxyribonuclease V alpha subunit